MGTRIFPSGAWPEPWMAAPRAPGASSTRSRRGPRRGPCSSSAGQLGGDLTEREVFCEARVRPVHDGVGLLDELASGLAIAKRVEEIRVADDTAIADDNVSGRILDDERLSRLDGDELVDRPAHLRRLDVVEEAVVSDAEPLARRGSGEHLPHKELVLDQERLARRIDPEEDLTVERHLVVEREASVIEAERI